MSELLSSAQVDALQAVDLRLGWIHHGYRATQFYDGLPYSNGPARYGISDTDYAVPALLLSDMEPGDVSAREGVENEQWPGLIPTNRQVVERVTSILHQIPYTNRKPLQELPECSDIVESAQLADANPTGICAIPELAAALNTSIEVGRELWALSPFDYLNGLAAVKGVRRALADSPNEKRRLGKAEQTTVRDRDMAQALGDIAIEMANDSTLSSGRKPKLAFTAGAGHSRLEKILDSYNLNYSSYTANRLFSEKLFEITLYFGSSNTHAIAKRVAKFQANQWFGNLRMHGKTPVDPTLGPIRSRF